MSPIGLTWRVVGVILLVSTWWVASGGGLLVMAIWGFGGLGVFFVFWSIADSFDSWYQE